MGGTPWIIKQTAFLLRLDLTSLKYSFMRNWGMTSTQASHEFLIKSDAFYYSAAAVTHALPLEIYSRGMLDNCFRQLTANCRVLISVTYSVLLYRVGFWHCMSAAPPGSPDAWPLLFGRLGAAPAMGLRRPAAVLHSSSITACGLQVPELPSTASQVSRHLPFTHSVLPS